MYPVTNAVKALFEAEQTQVLRITGTDRNGASINITDADVLQNGFSIDRYCCNGDKLEIGTAVAAEMTLRLDNGDGRFDDIIFEGTELYVEVGIADWSQSVPSVSYVPCGYFTPDEQPRKLGTITIHALDRMMNFDNATSALLTWTNHNDVDITDHNGKSIDFAAELRFPYTVGELIAEIANRCGVPFSQNITTLPNYNYSIPEIPAMQQNVTYRNILQWCAGMMGTNAWIDWDGNLRFSWYNTSTGYVTTTQNRYTSDVYENAITITGVKYIASNEDKTVYLAGTDEYSLDVSANSFVNEANAATVITGIYSVVHDFVYTPFTATVVNAPYMWPMDRVTFTDKDGINHISLLTNVRFSLNGTTDISANGETYTNNARINADDFTVQQSQQLERIQRVNSLSLQAAVEYATQMITGGLGGFVVLNVNEETGQTEEILIMDTPDKQTAVNVWRFNSAGLGHSSNGYAGPYNDLALTADGRINANMITTGILNADLIQAGSLNADLIQSGHLNANIIRGGTIDGESVNAKLLNIVDENDEVIASFDDVITLGLQSFSKTLIDFNSLEIVDQDNNPYFFVGDLREKDGYVHCVDTFTGDGSTRTYKLTYNAAPGQPSLRMIVSVNGTIMERTTQYTIQIFSSYTSIIFTDAATPPDGSEIKVSYLSQMSAPVLTLFARNPDEPIAPYSVSMGNNCTASGKNSFAIGDSTAAVGLTSYAEGKDTVASQFAHAEGLNTYAGYGGHAEGTNCEARGQWSHAEGYYTKVGGHYSHSEGHYTSALSSSCHAEGSYTTARGERSHAEGDHTVASNWNAHAEGSYTEAAARSQHVFGEYNIIDQGDPVRIHKGVYIEIVGKGTSNSNRSNARTLDWSGNEWIAGTLTQASDARLKRDAGEVPDVSEIRAHRFRWTDGTHDDKDHIGYYAQDVEAVAPYLVSEDASGHKALDYIGLLCAKIDSLEKRIAELEGRD